MKKFSIILTLILLQSCIPIGTKKAKNQDRSIGKKSLSAQRSISSQIIAPTIEDRYIHPNSPPVVTDMTSGNIDGEVYYWGKVYTKGGINTNRWRNDGHVTYTLNIPTTGSYKLQAKVITSNQGNGRRFNSFKVDVTGNLPHVWYTNGQNQIFRDVKSYQLQRGQANISFYIDRKLAKISTIRLIPEFSAYDVINSSVQLNPTSFRMAAPTFSESSNFTRAISSPHFTPIRVAGVDYIYAIFRVREAHGDVIRMARISAENYSNLGVPKRLNNPDWQWIPKSNFSFPREGAASDGTEPVMPSIVGIKGKILITIKLVNKSRGQRISSRVGLIQPTGILNNHQLLWGNQLRRVKDIPSYKGPKGWSLLHLTRVMKGSPDSKYSSSHSNPNLANQFKYFNSWEGRIIIGYQCSVIEDGNGNIDSEWTGNTCRYMADPNNPKQYHRTFFIQEVNLTDDAYNIPQVSFGAPIKILTDGMSTTSRAEAIDSDGKYYNKFRKWKKQNFIISSKSNDTLFFSLMYSKTSEHHEPRPVDRDYPRYSSFFEIPSLSQILEDKRSGMNVKMTRPFEHEWLEQLQAGNTRWDQGALWSPIYFYNPHDQAKHIFYESWGAEYEQTSAKTKNSFYPGSIQKFIQASDTARSTKSCNTFCRERKYQGGACLSAQAHGRGSPNHGKEINHELSLTQFRQSHPNITAAVYVCSDIGTRRENYNAIFEYRELFETDIAFKNMVSSNSNTLKNHAHNVCTRNGFRGVIALESQEPTRAGSSTLVHRVIRNGGARTHGQSYRVTCSTEYLTSRFSVQLVQPSENKSCDQKCNSLGAGHFGTGFRPYVSEVGPHNTQCSLYGVKVAPDFNVHMNSSCGASTLTCVCGPGRTMRAVMTGRRVISD